MKVALIAEAPYILVNVINMVSVLIAKIEDNHTSTCRECKPVKEIMVCTLACLQQAIHTDRERNEN